MKVQELFPNLPIKPSYTIRELSRATGLSRYQLHQAINRQDLHPVLRLGKKDIRIPLTSFESYLETTIYDPYL